MPGPRNTMEGGSANDVVAQTRCDSRALAVIGTYYHKEGEYLVSISQLLRMITEDMRRLIVQHGLGEDILSVTDAREILGDLGMKSLNASGRGKRNLFQALQREALILEGVNPITPARVTKHMRDRDSQRLDGELDAAKTPEGQEALRKKFVGDRAIEDAKQNITAADALSRAPDSLVVKTEKKGDEDE